MYTAQLQKLKAPIAIRYPRGQGVTMNWRQPFEEVEIGEGVTLKTGGDIAFLSVGTIAKNVTEAIEEKQIAHFDMRFIKPLDTYLLHKIFKDYNTIITIEDGTVVGGFGSAILEFASLNKYKNNVHTLGIPDKFIEHGSISELHASIGLDVISLKRYINDL